MLKLKCGLEKYNAHSLKHKFHEIQMSYLSLFDLIVLFLQYDFNKMWRCRIYILAKRYNEQRVLSSSQGEQGAV